jgi:hypothetical protein
VLLLGRFTGGRLAILERLRDELRKRGFLQMVFNFEKPETKDFTETIRTLAGLSRFIIADITNPKSTPLELQATIPEYMVPFVPIIEQGEEPFSMFKDLWVKHREWVFEPISYSSIEELVQGLGRGIIEPALERFDELMKKKRKSCRSSAWQTLSGTPLRDPSSPTAAPRSFHKRGSATAAGPLHACFDARRGAFCGDRRATSGKRQHSQRLSLAGRRKGHPPHRNNTARARAARRDGRRP